MPGMVPRGWSETGELPSFETATATEEQLATLVEDLWSVDKIGDGSLMVGWMPHMDPAGRFVARLFRRGNFDQWVWEHETRSLAELRAALVAKVAEIDAEPILVPHIPD